MPQKYIFARSIPPTSLPTVQGVIELMLIDCIGGKAEWWVVHKIKKDHLSSVEKCPIRTLGRWALRGGHLTLRMLTAFEMYGHDRGERKDDSASASLSQTTLSRRTCVSCRDQTPITFPRSSRLWKLHCGRSYRAALHSYWFWKASERVVDCITS